MRSSTALLTAFLFASPVLAQERPETTYWTPDAALIAQLEAGLKISGYPGAHSYQLAEYDRYYAGQVVNGRRQVLGMLIVPPNREDKPVTGVHITEMKFMPRIPGGGGCAVVRVIYTVGQAQTYGQCYGLRDGGAPPSQEPHWNPDEKTAQRMEAAIRDYMRRAYRGLGLEGYSRYYWGVTIDGRPVIRGRIMKLSRPGESAGMHLASDWDNGPILFDGGCNNIQSRFDVTADRLVELSCDGQGGMQPEVPLP